jgi:hypothetical protein
MNRERTRNGKIISRIHALVQSEPERARLTGRALLVMAMSVMAGVAVALIWLNQIPHGSLETLPDALAKMTSTLIATEVSAEVAETSVADVAEASDTASAVLPAGTPALVAMAEMPLGAAAGNPLIQSAFAQRGTVAPPSPIPTSTPMPPIDSVEAVVAIGGTDVWDAASGLLVAQAKQGSLLVATTQSADGAWLYVTLPDGIAGWALAEELIVFDADRLVTESVVINAVTPTPANSASMPAATPSGAQASAAQAGGLPAEIPILRSTPVMGEGPIAKVVLEGSRLNVRSGPDSNSPIIAKALPGEIFVILGRDASRKWLQLALPDVDGGFGWAAAEFLQTDATLADLPVVDESTKLPAYQEQPSNPGAQGAAPSTAASLVLLPTPTSGPTSAAVVISGDTGDSLPSIVFDPVPVVAPSELSGKLAIQTTWGGDIYLYDLATGELRLLTGGFDPAISPDGSQVAFTRAGGEHGLYLINVDGSNQRLIFSGRELLRSPKWSPDGQYIVFERGDELLRCNDLDPDDPASPCVPGPNTGTEVQEKFARVDFNGQNYQDIPVLERAHAPDWNSAGIVYHSPAGIQLTQDQPSAKSKLVFFNIRKQYELDPDWQPNGGRIIFQRRENDHWEIYSVAMDGSGLTALTRPDFTLVEKLPSNVAPAWSPDGTHIIFLSNRMPNQSAGAWDVWVMNADGSNQRPLGLDLDFTYTFVAEQMLDWGR